MVTMGTYDMVWLAPGFHGLGSVPWDPLGGALIGDQLRLDGLAKHVGHRAWLVASKLGFSAAPSLADHPLKNGGKPTSFHHDSKEQC